MKGGVHCQSSSARMSHLLFPRTAISVQTGPQTPIRPRPHVSRPEDPFNENNFFIQQLNFRAQAQLSCTATDDSVDSASSSRRFQGTLRVSPAIVCDCMCSYARCAVCVQGYPGPPWPPVPSPWMNGLSSIIVLEVLRLGRFWAQKHDTE